MRYVIVDQYGNVINAVLWDGVSPYSPGANLTLVQSGTAGAGWTYAGGTFTPPSGD